jgi:hypothetical protein
MIERSDFDHVGLITSERREGETWLEEGRLWVTNPRTSPYHIEWLRFASDSPVTGPTRERPHVAFRVRDLAEAIADHAVVLEPTVIGDGFAKIAYIEADGALIEFMEYADPDEEGWL